VVVEKEIVMTLVDVLGLSGVVIFLIIVDKIYKKKDKTVEPIATRYVTGHVLENYALLNLVEVSRVTKEGVSSSNLVTTYTNMITIRTNFNEVFEIQTIDQSFNNEKKCLSKNKYNVSEDVEFIIGKYKEDGQWMVLKEE